MESHAGRTEIPIALTKSKGGENEGENHFYNVFAYTCTDVNGIAIKFEKN